MASDSATAITAALRVRNALGINGKDFGRNGGLSLTGRTLP
jgi:hypothetical protein